MKRPIDWFGVALSPPHIGETTIGQWVREIFSDDEGVVAGARMFKLSTSTSGWQSGRERRIDAKLLADVVRRCDKGKVGHIFAYDRDVDMNASLNREWECLRLVVSAVRTSTTDTYHLILTGPETLYDQNALLSYLRQLVGHFGVDYGCIVSGLTLFHVDTLLTYTDSAMIEEERILRERGPQHPRNRFAREIPFYQSKCHQFSQYIPRASWGNILNQAHVDALGGEDRARRESGAYLVERWGENLYVQLTESLWDCTSDDLVRLNEFFKPAHFPNAPEAVYLDRSSDPYPLG